MSLNLFKLEKLRFKAFKNVERTQQIGQAFEVMFNPTSWAHHYSIEYLGKQGINTSGAQLKYSQSNATKLELKLIFDGTGVHDTGIASPLRKSVKDRVQAFLDLVWQYNGSIHEPNYLLAEWGSLKYSCRLMDAHVNYTLFDRDGTPLRAEFKVTLMSDIAALKRALAEKKTSPDLTHARIVRAGDTLPLLTVEIYGSSAPYLDIARFNQLDDFRNLTPGQQLLFPPLATFGRSANPGEKG